MNNKFEIFQKNIELSDQKIDVLLLKFGELNYGEYYFCLSQDEQERADKLKVELKRKQFVITRGILRKLLSKCFGKDAKEIKISYGQHGKPFIEDKLNDKSVEFNISHSDDYGLIAITLDNKIGVDIEKLNPVIDYQSLSNRFFSDKEKEELSSLDKELQLDAFYRIWVRKESFIKATGKGISYGLDKFSVSSEKFKQTNIETRFDNEIVEQWQCYDLMHVEDYKAALISCKKDIEIIVYL
jgi:4'-phosphopantetheinyl transferase